MVSTVCNFNGDDAIVLKNGSTVLDVIGQVGCNPGSRWQLGSFLTLDKTLIRNPEVCVGYDGSIGGTCGTGSFPTLNIEWIQKIWMMFQI
ncbi:MAG: hypothetical protein IPP48_03985 [Chitinophagaceae bacterium]|nr:hypothetical protein [Chitinophagaceae bacterium]